MSSNFGGGDPSQPRPIRRRVIRTQEEGDFGQSPFDSEVVPSSLAEIAPILRVANEVESSNPRVAYLCRFYAFDKALRLDPTSSGRGVRQFKTAVLRQLQIENERTLMGRRKRSDAREMLAFYEDYYNKYINELQNAADKAARTQLRKAYQTASVLFEVLKAVDVDGTQVDSEILEVHQKVAEKSRIYVPYNILPLDPDSADQAIMIYPEIQAVLFALRCTKGLPWPKEHEKEDIDILDWLQSVFGFQKDNVSNQREHLILLLANIHMRQFPKLDEILKLDDKALDHVMEKLLENYKKWCKFLDCKSSLWLPIIKEEIQQRKLLYMGLFLLIWGEAANLRFMPECLCYIYHHMALELHDMLAGNVNCTSGENVKPAYGDEEEAFLRKVVTPIYSVIAKEAQNNKNGTSKHSEWRNYDDLNEYFWSTDCFRLGWPMCADADFFHLPEKCPPLGKTEDQWIGKSNFVEIRSFWQIFRSFDRMWNFFILSLQVMIIVAWNGDGNPTALFMPNVFGKVLSVFITAAILKLGQVLLDVILNWKARRSMSKFIKLRYILKIISAASWIGILLVTYAYEWDNPPGFAQTIISWFGSGEYSPPLFIIAILIYSSPKMLDVLLFFLPSIRCFLERSNYKIVLLLMWWSQPRLYVGRGMHESVSSLFKYTLFWVLLLITKLVFSFMIEIRPLVGLTKELTSFSVGSDEQDYFFPLVENNFGIVIAFWAPVILVYFMDTQIWYAIFSSLCGVIYGAFHRLGEIQTLGMFRSHFKSFPGVFNVCLVPEDKNEPENKGPESTVSPQHHQVLSNKEKEAARFSQLWNQIIVSFREEDLIDNWEMNLLLVPYWADREMGVIQWPLMLLSNKIILAMDMAKGSYGKDGELKKRINNDYYMSCAIHECYAQFRSIIWVLVQGEREKEIVEFIFNEVDGYIEAGELISKIEMSALDTLYKQFLRLINYLSENKQEDTDKVVILFQDMLEVVRRDMMEDDHLSSIVEPMDDSSPLERAYQMCFASAGAIRFPIQPVTEAWQEKIKRIYLLLATRESALDVPSNLDARRRISFFSNSLFMEMPAAPEIHNMLSFSILTSHYMEKIFFSLEDLETLNEDGISTLFYLQKIFPDEWNNFLERVSCSSEDELGSSDELEQELRLWASCRSQTLTRTVRGMMYHRKALELQAFLDMVRDEELMEGYKAVELGPKDPSRGDNPLWAQCQAAVDMKFTFVLSCQQYGNDRRAGHPRAQDILRLMTTYPSLRVAYIDEVEDLNQERDKNMSQKVYYSTLVKASPNSMDKWPLQNLDQIIYRIKLPGNPTLGEGKAENQNHAIIFTRGEGLQMIDFNQDNYMEEALKMRNLLQEFLSEIDDVRHPTILGLREHIFTGSVSSLAWLISNLETSYTTIGQRFLANPLKVRFHYGHPDVFDRLFHLTRGGISKASKVINLSRDIFAGNVTHHEYIQVGKGRGVGFNEISMLDAHVAMGVGEQTLSRDVYRLGHCFDFFRMLSCYFTTVGFYFSSLITELTLYVFLYGRLYIVLSGLETSWGNKAIRENVSLQVALASQLLVQIGFVMVLPMFMEILLERGLRSALSNIVLMPLQLSPIFFSFSLGTKAHHYGRTLLHGGKRCRATGHFQIVSHAKFAENYRLYSRSHFVKGFELIILLILCAIYGDSYNGAIAYFIFSVSMIWFVVGSWLFAPFVFNPSGFEWQKIVDGWTDWNKWIMNSGGIGVPPERSWESWWEEEQEHLRFSGKCGCMFEILLALRFFVLQYGLVYHLSSVPGQSILIYGLPWLVVFLVLFVMKFEPTEKVLWRGIEAVSKNQIRLKAQTRATELRSQATSPGGHKFRVKHLLKWLIVISFVSILVRSITLPHKSLKGVILCFVALLMGGWGMLSIAQVLKPIMQLAGLWDAIRSLAQGYDILMGLILFAPIAILAWLSFVSEIQTRILFNQKHSIEVCRFRVSLVGEGMTESESDEEVLCGYDLKKMQSYVFDNFMYNKLTMRYIRK